MNNGNRNYATVTAYKDPSSGLFSLYEPCGSEALDSNVSKTLTPVLGKDGKPMRVDERFLESHGISERTGP